MKAVIVTHYGTPQEALKYVEDLPTPTAADLKPSQVLLRVHAAALNRGESKILGTLSRWFFPLEFPSVFGIDGAGEVVATGSAVTKVAAGDSIVCRFVGFMRKEKPLRGTYAQYAVVDELDCAKKPDSLSWQQAASMPNCGIAALQVFRVAGIFDTPSPRQFKSVLIHGASGGVGSFVVLLAKHMLKVEKVYGTCSARNRDYVMSLGADRVIDYNTEDFVDVIQKEQGEAGVDFVFDCVGGSDLTNRSVECISNSGHFLSIALEDSSFSGTVSSLFAFAKKMAWYWLGFGPKVSLVIERTTADLDKLMTFFGEHKELMDLMSLTQYDLTDVANAFDIIEQGRTRGKIVVNVP